MLHGPQVASAPRAARAHDLGGVRGKAGKPSALCRPLRRLPLCARRGIEDLPRSVRQEPLLGRWRAVGRPVEIRAYAERVDFWQDGKIVGPHERAFGRDKAIYDPLHYIPVPARKPGALRNGAPFKEWELPAAIRRVQRKLGKVPNGDRQMVQILSMTDRRTGCGGNRLRGSPERRPPGGSCGPEHPGPASRTATAADHRHAGCAAADLRARGRLQTLRQPEETDPWKDHRCWTRWASRSSTA